MVKQAQRRVLGASLIEALVAMLVMALGLLAVTGIQSRLRQSGDAAKQRTEATRIAQAEMQRLRSYSVLSRDASTPSAATVYAELGDYKEAEKLQARVMGLPGKARFQDWSYLGDIRYSAGNRTAARRAYRQALASAEINLHAPPP